MNINDITEYASTLCKIIIVQLIHNYHFVRKQLIFFKTINIIKLIPCVIDHLCDFLPSRKHTSAKWAVFVTCF